MTKADLIAFMNHVGGGEKILALYCDNDKIVFYRDKDLLEEDIVTIGDVDYVVDKTLTMLRESPRHGRMDVKVHSYIPIDNIQGIIVVPEESKTEVDNEYLNRC